MNALAAYRRGATGAGVKVAVIDSGIDVTSPQFAGRIDPASADLTGNGSLADVGGHGTGVALALAAGRDGIGTHGIAFDATVMVFRVDFPGTCAAGDCIFSLSAVETAIDRARQAGARIVNLSMISEAAPRSTLLAAIDGATAAGMTIVVCSGNSPGASSPQGWATGLALSPEARGQVVIAGFANGSDNLLGPRAGIAAAHFVAAAAGSCSESTPVVAGALALIAQGSPNLTGAELVARLYASARDAGAPGQDTVYGRGIVDLTRAFP
jgi:subtilisin family serine protease